MNNATNRLVILVIYVDPLTNQPLCIQKKRRKKCGLCVVIQPPCPLMYTQVSIPDISHPSTLDFLLSKCFRNGNFGIILLT